MKLKEITHKFSTARAEFHSLNNSVYEKFVVPPYIDSIDLAKIDHSMSIVGGRGCGKTTFVRYFSHWTQFDKARPSVDVEALNCIILYWKPDTNYFRSMSQSWLSEQNAKLFFQCLSGICILEELIFALDNISHHFPALAEEISSCSLFWKKIHKITKSDIHDLRTLLRWIEDVVFDIQMSINSNDVTNLIRIDAGSVFTFILPDLVESCSVIQKSKFKIFVDEFENLAEYQQRIINGYRKHSNAFVSWNVAHKRFAQLSNATEGNEKLQHGNDYRDYILDESFGNEAEKKFFLSELFLLALLKADLKCPIENFNSDTLGDRDFLESRKESVYRLGVTDLVIRILPTVRSSELARIALEKQAVSGLTELALTKIAKLSKKNIKLLFEKHPDVAIATLAISSQQSFKPESLLNYIESDFSSKHSYNQRVKTYLLTALLNLNARYAYISIPVYSGFDRFCLLSSLNIRHFFDLCYHSFLLMDGSIEIDSIEAFPAISLDQMHQGAINASNNIIKEIPTYTPLGLTLSGLVNRLGDIFQIWQKGESQSEPERTHFYIPNDFGSLPARLNDVIEQAKCWRVLIEYPATKDKNSNASSGYEYRLNPIYSPSFDISYRKIRRIEISEQDFDTLCFGGNEAYKVIRAKHIQQSRSPIEGRDNQGSLFE